MVKLVLKRNGSPDYFQGFVYHDEKQVMTFFFSKANKVILDGETHVSFFAYDDDTVACLNLATVSYPPQTLDVLDDACSLYISKV
ncbi:hypothetical protein QWY97_05375 [Vibrio cortegadensis]|uniref:hypothetical protein n=1 Tax=Vibrio cortegadensis TaxID=1328770 RepID=UPI0021C2F1E0|nr:hypothetical protein [Vibrio cortegadensis]MDN3696781.1 hypothetical protein [Vibrio cortegadensis]